MSLDPQRVKLRHAFVREDSDMPLGPSVGKIIHSHAVYGPPAGLHIWYLFVSTKDELTDDR